MSPRIDDNVLFKRVDDFEFSARTYNCLKSLGIVYLGDLLNKLERELLRVDNFGRKSLREVQDTLEKMSLSLGMLIPDWEEKKRKHEESLSQVEAEPRLKVDVEERPSTSLTHFHLKFMRDVLVKAYRSGDDLNGMIKERDKQWTSLILWAFSEEKNLESLSNYFHALHYDIWWGENDR